MVAGALGAGALMMSAAGTASAKGWEDGLFDQDIRCAPSFSFSLLFPGGEGCRTDIFIDNHKRLDLVRQLAGGDITGTTVRRGGGRR
ncbi:hypothetical protein AB0C96_30750 [Streptomyces sp. NPDC048506]|uniref:hypothetical protein n=1 Tax=Streptomyces sp. NPDC048506 TaxID=3155028 RepID=UPI00343313FE